MKVLVTVGVFWATSEFGRLGVELASEATVCSPLSPMWPINALTVLSICVLLYVPFMPLFVPYVEFEADMNGRL